MRHLIKERGFTLIEMVMVIMLLGIIAVVSSKALTEGFDAYLAGKNILSADWQARLALERMARDIHVIRSPTDISTATSSQLVFTDMDGTGITYQLSGTTLMRNSQVLADGIQTLTLSYFDSNGASTSTTSLIRYVQISLTITLNNTNFTLSTAVNPRDLL